MFLSRKGKGKGDFLSPFPLLSLAKTKTKTKRSNTILKSQSFQETLSLSLSRFHSPSYKNKQYHCLIGSGTNATTNATNIIDLLNVNEERKQIQINNNNKNIFFAPQNQRRHGRQRTFSTTNSTENIQESILDCIGNTPLVKIDMSKLMSKEEKENDPLYAEIIAKLESNNPCSSVKDRIGLSMIEEAEKRGDIHPAKTVLIEPTSGNTGIGLAMVAAAKGYKLILTMPESMSIERRIMLGGFGAEIILTPAPKGMTGAVMMAKKLLKEKYPENGFILQQFENQDNPKIHENTTGPEIWRDTGGKVDILLGGVGTGGTLTGCTRYLRKMNPEMKTIAIEPSESAVMSGGSPAPHKIQGLGAGFIPGTADVSLFNEIFKVEGLKAVAMAQTCMLNLGLCVGISSGAALLAAKEVAKRKENKGKRIVVIIPSFGERYLSSILFDDLREKAQNLRTQDIDW